MDTLKVKAMSNSRMSNSGLSQIVLELRSVDDVRGSPVRLMETLYFARRRIKNQRVLMPSLFFEEEEYNRLGCAMMKTT